MPSLLYPDNGSRRVERNDGKPAIGARAYLYADEALTIPAEAYRDVNGVKGALLATDEEGRRYTTLDAYGRFRDFWGPADGQDRLWALIGGVKSPVDADYNARIDAIAGGVTGALLKDANLGDLDDVAAALTNLGLGDAALRNVGAGAGTVAAGDDSRISGAAQKAANLGDLNNPAAGRANLELGTAATRDVGTTSSDVAAGNAPAAAQAAAISAAATDATAKAGDAEASAVATAVQRSNHTGVQAMSTVTGLESALTGKADLVGGVVPSSQIPAQAKTDFLGAVGSQAAMLALTGQAGDWATRTDTGTTWQIIGADPTQLSSWYQHLTPTDAVQSVNGQIGPVTLAASDVGAPPTARTITTTAPLTGGGDLSANRTIAVSAATAGATGVVQLAGDLAGTAIAPTVPGLAGKVDKIDRLGEKVFTLNFTGGVVNQKADLYFTGSTNGVIEVSVVSEFSGADALGAMRAVYAFSGNDSGVSYHNTMSYTVSQGNLPSHFALMPIAWDAGNGRWKLTIAHRTSTANPIAVRATWQQLNSSGATALHNTLSASAVYTTDTTIVPVAGPHHRNHRSATREVLAADPYYGTPGTRAAFINALDDAESLGKGTVVRLAAGLTVDVVSTLSLSGRSCQIVGAGAGIDGAGANVSVIKASAQTGPVLNFSGYVRPENFRGRIVPLALVMIQGSGLADPTRVNSGFKCTSMSSAYFHDIAIYGTGGPCVELAESPGDAFYLSDMDRVTMFTPVGAKTNDVAYFYANECNGNRFRGLGFRATSGGGDCGASGAAIIASNATYPSYANLYDGWWFEYLHPPTNGTLFSHQGNLSTIRDFQFHDCQMDADATSGTSFFRFLPPVVDNFGANTLAGDIPGDNGTTTHIHTGVDMRQSRNVIDGTKGYQGKNVTLAAGVDRCYAHLRGGVSAASGQAFIDNSGSTNNHLIDEYGQVEVRPVGWIIKDPQGPAGDYSTDDTAALQAKINRVSVGVGTPAVEIELPPGTFRITNTLVIHKKSVIMRGAGIGNPTNYGNNPGRGTTIIWDGPAGIPMISVRDSIHCTFEDLFLQGSLANRPSEGILFNNVSGDGAGTNENIKISRVRIGGFPWTTPDTTPYATHSLDYGVRWAGDNTNNDQFSLEDVVINSCANAAIALPNSQSIWGELQNVFVSTCAIGLQTSASVVGWNLSFDNCGTDIQTNSTAQVMVYGHFSERSAKIFDVTNASSLRVNGGWWTISSEMQGAPHFARALLLNRDLVLRDVRVVWQISPRPPLLVTGSADLAPYWITIEDCDGITMDELAITGSSAPGFTHVNIRALGMDTRTSLTGLLTAANADTRRLPPRRNVPAKRRLLSGHPYAMVVGTVTWAKDLWLYMPLSLDADLPISYLGTIATTGASGGTATMRFALFTPDGNGRPSARKADYSSYGTIDLTTGVGGENLLLTTGLVIPAGNWMLGCAWSGTATTPPVIYATSGVHPGVYGNVISQQASAYAQSVSGASAPLNAVVSEAPAQGVAIYAVMG